MDANGRIVASINFDVEDRAAAAIELRERFARHEELRSMPPAIAEFARALDTRDLARVRAALPDDFVMHDHRRTGMDRLGPDQYIAALAAMFALAPDAMTETLRWIAVAPHGDLSVGRWFGRLADGGEFESLFLRLADYGVGRHFSFELFELEDYDRAMARFEELRGKRA